MQDPERELLVESLFCALEAERYVRAALLRTLVDELDVLGRSVASDLAEAILARLDAGSVHEREFVESVRELREHVLASDGAPASIPAEPESGVRTIGGGARRLATGAASTA